MNKFYLSCWECACTFLLGLVKIKSIRRLQNVPNSIIDCQTLWVLWNCPFYFFLSVILCFFFYFHEYVSVKVLFFGRSRIMASVSPSIFVNWLLVKLRSYVFVSSISWVVPTGTKVHRVWRDTVAGWSTDWQEGDSKAVVYLVLWD